MKTLLILIEALINDISLEINTAITFLGRPEIFSNEYPCLNLCKMATPPLAFRLQ